MITATDVYTLRLQGMRLCGNRQTLPRVCRWNAASPAGAGNTVTPPEPVTKPIAVTPKDHSRVPAVEEL
ncbi:MAG: hypothetical protein ABSD89_09780 [Halobacteriota archaeon]|jgi:hypothetical protein